MAAILAPLPALALEGRESPPVGPSTGLTVVWWVVAVARIVALLVLLGGRSRGARR